MMPDFRPGSKCINLRCITNRNNHRMGNFRSIIAIFVRWLGRSLATFVILCVPSMSVLNSTHPSWQAPHQGLQSLGSQGIPGSHHCITQLLLCCRRVIQITNMDNDLVQDMLNGVHIRAFGWPFHYLHILIFENIIVARALCDGASP